MCCDFVQNDTQFSLPMSDVVISVENLSKSYLVGHKSASLGRHNDTFRDAIERAGRNLLHNAMNIARGRQVVLGDQIEEFWALKDISFEVKRGEVRGIIGRNGAGKSTLLKILSRITEPTRGRITLRGRVASLLEVGTGFHPELTGRENIYLNGAILGMTRAEIRRKFDEIVAFAEIERFLDTPVKRYSSGMYVRLAFAVAAHLEPEILVVDEVLAVGDIEFQRKCIGKMQDVATGEGRTVFFVSHNLPAIVSLCTSAMCLNNGEIVQIGAPATVCAAYAALRTAAPRSRYSSSMLLEMSLLDGSDQPCPNLIQGARLKFRVIVTPPEGTAIISVIVRDGRDSILFELYDLRFSLPKGSEENTVIDIDAAKPPLLPGLYAVDLWFGDRMANRIDRIDGAFEFEVVTAAKAEVGPPFAGGFGYTGSFYYPSEWTRISARVADATTRLGPAMASGLLP
jgi:lipopolysaccharide transport system ATP-binding protein